MLIVIIIVYNDYIRSYFKGWGSFRGCIPPNVRFDCFQAVFNRYKAILVCVAVVVSLSFILQCRQY
jgi:hypothetical protein